MLLLHGFYLRFKKNKYQPSSIPNANTREVSLNFEDVLNLPDKCTLLNESTIKKHDDSTKERLRQSIKNKTYCPYI